MHVKPYAVVYHRNCMDGTAAAYAAKLLLGNDAEYIPLQYKEKFNMEQFRDRVVFLLDFSFKRGEFLTLKDIASDVIVLDHHKSAQEEIGDLVDINLTKSGAVLAWEYFHKDKPLPLVYQYVQDRDLWNKELPSSEAISEWLFFNGFTLDDFERAYHTDLSSIVPIGKVLLEVKARQIDSLAKNARIIEIDGFKVPCCNAPTRLASDLGGYLCKDQPFAVIYSDIGTDRIFNLRSSKGREKVNELAGRFGGGGHLYAAGFSLPINSSLLSDFTNRVIMPNKETH